LLGRWVIAEDRAGYSPTFDAITLLHHGQAAAALDRAGLPMAHRVLLHWHVAQRVEAAVLPGRRSSPVTHRRPRRRPARRRPRTPLGHRHRVQGGGPPYQRAVRLILAGPDTASTGEAVLIDLGITSAG
jgi:hypothetical protein